MIDEREEALNALLRAYDERLAAGPVVDRRVEQVDRRGAGQSNMIEASRVAGPVDYGFAYWVSPSRGARAAR